MTASCSQILMTFQPASSSRRLVSASRALVRSNFPLHQSELDLGMVPCLGHWCQKQPSTKTATCCRVNTRSASRRSSSTGRRCKRKRRPLRCSSDRSNFSGGCYGALARPSEGVHSPKREREPAPFSSTSCRSRTWIAIGPSVCVCPVTEIRCWR